MGIQNGIDLASYTTNHIEAFHLSAAQTSSWREIIFSQILTKARE